MVSPKVPAEFGGTCHQGTWGFSVAPAYKSCCVIGRVLPMLNFAHILDAQESQYQHSWQKCPTTVEEEVSPNWNSEATVFQGEA